MTYQTLIAERAELVARLAAIEAELQAATVAPTDFASTLSACKGGETIVLQDAAYGGLYLKVPDWTEPVTIIGGRLGDVELIGVPGLHFDGTVIGSLEARNLKSNLTRQLTLQNVRAGSADLSYVQGFSVTDCAFDSGQFLLVLAGCTDGVVSRTMFTGWAEDAMRITRASRNLLIEGNHWHSPSTNIPAGTHSDMIQMFGRDGVGPSDITIRRNLMRAQPRPRTEDQHQTQGFLVNNHTGGGFRNVVIEENLIDAASVTVAVFDGLVEGCAFRRNIQLPLGRSGKIGQVRIVNSPGCIVEDNLAPLITDVSAGTDLAATLRDNIMWRRGVDPFVTPTGELSDFLVRSDVSIPQGVGPDPEWIRSIAS